MADPSVPPNADEIETAVDEALHGLELEPHETAAILGFANEELSHLQTPETSYYVLGSYRNPYVRRLRKVENELNKRLGAYAFVMGDLREIGLDRLPEFRIRFHLLASYADYVVGVYEQDAGGEVTELGKTSETPYFDKSYVLPRDYCWMTGDNFDGKADVVAAAMTVYDNDDLTDDEKGDEIESLAVEARETGIDVSKDDLFDAIEERDDGDTVSYSWVHINEFRLFELHDRCQPWVEESELRDSVDIVPTPSRHPDWEE
ncbi:hypothetical protein M0R88_07240 [Halorussus gelatinilyticus]|uniref:Uncharacterized protein n=1 Tax=Halorussus gelatinilyticus TaxID=2937524 RepID=A0A8U0IMQ1_9EURY|nr:hypothetical protein [Halorussus gelatinilyticus]UPW01881.1 hypothetical protein M0R88_07240 [Halorussus gelatinilyticus]